MKTIILLFLIFTSTLLCCKNPNKKKGYSNEIGKRIENVENHLCSPIILGKSDSSFYSIRQRMDFYKVPGLSIAIINNKSIEWSRGYGVLNSENKNPVDDNTLFQAASISKSVAALGALYLVNCGKIDLDKNINNYLRSWKLPENEFTKDAVVTLRYLLCHGAGINGHMLGAYSQNEDIPTIHQLLEGIPPATGEPIRVVQKPQAEFMYSGGGYLVALLAMQDVSNKIFFDIMKDNILKPIGMKLSGFFQPLQYGSIENVATGHDEEGNPYVDCWLTFPNLAEGGLWTTPKELCLFAIEIQNAIEGKSSILSRDLAKEMLSVQIGSYGLGVLINGDETNLSFAHGGDSRGYHNYMYYSVSKGKGAVIMTNGQNGAYLYQEILRSIASVYDWSDFKPRLINPIDIELDILKKLCGRYVFNNMIYANISISGNHLKMKGDDGRTFDLYPIAENQFVDAISGWEVHFGLDENKDVVSVSINIGGLKLEGNAVTTCPR